jgi:hypothetical protein
MEKNIIIISAKRKWQKKIFIIPHLATEPAQVLW